MNEHEARAQGLRIIRPPLKVQKIINRNRFVYLVYQRHFAVKDIARLFNISRTTVYRIIKQFTR